MSEPIKDNQDSAAPAYGQQVFSAVAVVHKTVDDVPYIMVAKRSATKRFLPGKIELLGGHIDFGENMQAGLKRELKEEMGVDINLGAPFAVFDYINEVKGSHSIEVAYFATLISPEEQIAIDPADHSEWFWATENDLDRIADVNGPDDPERDIIIEAFRFLHGGTPDIGKIA